MYCIRSMICCFLFLLLCTTPLYPQQINGRTFDQAQGLPQIQVNALVQDSRGFMWFGTYSGLCRFDGTSMQYFTVEDGLASNHVIWLDATDDGRVFALTTFGLTVLKDGKIIYPVGGDKLSDDGRFYDGYYNASEDILYLASTNGLITFRDGKYDHILKSESSIHSICCSSQDSIWFAESQKIVHIRNGVRTEYLLDQSLTFRVFDIFDTGYESAFISTEAGLFEIRDGQTKRKNFDAISEFASYYEVIRGDEDGHYIAATREGLLDIRIGKESQLRTIHNGLPTNIINDLFINPEGDLWLGTARGATVIFPARFVHFTIDDGLAENEVQSIFQDSRGRLLVGGSSSTLTILEGGDFRSINLGDKLVGSSISDIVEDGNGTIYLCTSRGIAILGEDSVRLINTAVNAICGLVDSEGRFWIGALGGLYLFEEGKLKTALPDEFPEDKSVMDIREDRLGRIWIATRSKGVYMYQGGDLTNFNQDNGFTNRDVWSIAVDKAGTVWFGTNGQGLFRFDENTFTQYTVDDGLSENTVWAIICDNHGNIWCGTNRGIDKYDGEKFVLFTVDDGLSENEVMNDCGYVDREGRRWFGTISGLNLILYNNRISKHWAPPIYIEKFEVNGEYRPLIDENVELDSSERFVQIETAIPFYHREGSLVYKYKLEGLDEEWNQSYSLAPFRYSNLNPGRYTFRLKTVYKNIDSSNEAILSFSIAPPFYMSSWFPFIAIALISLAVYSFFALRTQQINATKNDLENKVRERTAELKSANRELEAFNLALTNNLKVPVRHIIGYSEIARAPEHLDKRDHYVSRIHDNAISLSRMIEDLHDLANAGSIILSPNIINLSLETRVIANALKRDNPEYKAELTIQEDVFANCDERLIRIVLQNLLSNALKATMHLDEGLIEFKTVEKENERIFVVTDNGIGLDEKQKELLFKPFSQIHSPEVFPGKGLGLIIVQRIIHRHGGEIWFDTELGQGMKISWTLPGSV